jgi:hypothetical protein
MSNNVKKCINLQTIQISNQKSSSKQLGKNCGKKPRCRHPIRQLREFRYGLKELGQFGAIWDEQRQINKPFEGQKGNRHNYAVEAL